MQVVIRRFNGETTFTQEYTVDAKDRTLLDILKEIKSFHDSSLTFRHACGSGICGSCSVRIDGRAVLACRHKPVGETIVVEPLQGFELLRDLVIDETPLMHKQRKAQAALSSKANFTPTMENRTSYARQATCIECASCYSACPVMATDPEFMGPYVLTKNLRYLLDEREGAEGAKLAAIQEKGVWDCILCGDCAMACPMGINSKMDISILQSKSMQAGYTNPNPPSFGGGFGGGFGSFDGFTPSFS